MSLAFSAPLLLKVFSFTSRSLVSRCDIVVQFDLLMSPKIITRLNLLSRIGKLLRVCDAVEVAC